MADATAMKNLNTRIRLKYDTLENWLTNDPVLLAGEVAMATVANTDANTSSTKFQNLPNVVMKVGDGTKKFSELNYFSAMAADVYAWAKSPTKPEYEAKDIKGLEDFINGEIQDSNTKFKLEQDANNAHILRLYSQDLGQSDWTMVNEITTADTVYDDTALAGRVTSLEGLVGAEKVETQIANAIAALKLSETYDAKGSAAQALSDAKAYADGKDTAIQSAANAAADADAKAQGAQDALDAYMESNDAALAAEVKRAGDAESALDGKIGEVNTAITDEVARATAAENKNAEAAAAAQKTADDVTALVGTLPPDAGEGIDTVVKYIDKKTADITSGTEFTELKSRVDAIESDYLDEADKTELSDLITAEKERAEGIESGLDARIKAVEDDYLTSEDKDELQDKIDIEKARIDVLIGEDTGKSARTIANEELAKQLVAEGAKESLDTLAEIAQWIQDHPDDASAMNKAIEDLEALVGTLPEGASATTIVGYVNEVIDALKIEDYAKASDLAALVTRVEAMEAKVASWDSAEQNAKTYADTLNTAMNTRMEAVEDKAHEHANKDELDLIAAGDKAKWDAAASKAHEHANAAELDKFVDGDKAKLDEAYAAKHTHANADVIDGITAEKVVAWDTAEENAKTYADDLNTAMDTRVTKAENDIAGLHAIANSGNVNDLVQTEGEYIVFNCGTSSSVI